MDDNEFRCKVCGGRLAIDDYTLGIVKCINCSNQSRVDASLLQELRKIPQQKVVNNVMVEMTKEDVEAAKRAKRRENTIYSIKCVISLMALLILGVYASIMYYSFSGNLELSNLELIIVSLCGITFPAIFGVFSKVTKGKKESLFLYLLLFMMCLSISGLIVYFATTRYLVVLLA